MNPKLETIIKAMPLPELITTCREIQDIIENMQLEEKNRLLGIWHEMAGQAGLSVLEITAGLRPVSYHQDEEEREGKRRNPARPKYRNPADPSQTWTGRGRKPHWVSAYLLAKGWVEVSKEASEEVQASNKSEMQACLADILIETEQG